MLIDEDDDGSLDRFYQLNIREITEQGIVQEVPEWKVKKYNDTVKHFSIADNNILAVFNDGKIRELESEGTASDRDEDNEEVSVVAKFRTHKITSEHDERRQYIRSEIERPLYFHELRMICSYPDGVPDYTVIGRDKDDNEIDISFTPLDSNDKRSHRTGFRIRSEEADFEVQQESMNRDEIRDLVIEWS